MSHYNAMICQPVTLSGYSEEPKMADTMIEAGLTMNSHDKNRLADALVACALRNYKGLSEHITNNTNDDETLHRYQHCGACKQPYTTLEAFVLALLPVIDDTATFDQTFGNFVRQHESDCPESMRNWETRPYGFSLEDKEICYCDNCDEPWFPAVDDEVCPHCFGEKNPYR